MKFPKFAALSVRTRLIGLFSIIIFTISMFFNVYTIVIERDIYTQNFNKTASAIEKYLRLGLEYGIDSDNLVLMRKVLDGVRRDENVCFVALFDSDKRIYASYPAAEPEPDEVELIEEAKEDSVSGEFDFGGEFDFSDDAQGEEEIVESEENLIPDTSDDHHQVFEADVRGFINDYAALDNFSKVNHFEDNFVVRKHSYSTREGDFTLFVGFPTKDLRERKKSTVAHSAVVSLLGISLGVALVILFSQTVSGPIKKLESVARKIASGDYLKRADEFSGGREIRGLAESFNAMINEILNSQKKLFSEMSKYNTSLDRKNKKLSASNEALEIEIAERRKAEELHRSGERLMRVILDANPASIIYLCKDLKYKQVNKTYLETFRHTEKEIQEKPLKEAARPRIAELIIEKIERIKKNKKEILFEITTELDGEETTFLTGINPNLDENGQILGYVVVALDISAERRSRTALEESERKFRALSESAQDAIIIMNNDAAVSFWNKAAERIFGHPEESALGKDLHELIAPPEIFEDFRRGFEQFRRSGKGEVIGKTLELEALGKSGRRFPIELSLSGVKIREKWNAIGIARDISERKRMESDLRRSKEEAETANRAKSEFLANMSHEIRTPMNAILGFSQLLMSKVENEKLLSYIEAINSGGKSLLGLINDILDLSKIEAGRLELDYEAVNPYSIFKEIQNVFSYKIAEKGLRFETEIDEDIPKGLVLDEIRLRQILVNLVGNALKFTEEGYIKLSAAKEFTDEDDSKVDLTFSVKDSGIGISKDQQVKIFEAFRQQSGQSARKYGGTGLGLAITKRLVEMMNGEISVESESGVGSTFKVKIVDIAVSSTLRDEDQRRDNLNVEIVFKDAKILIVDDIEVNRKLVREYFEKSDVKIYEAENGVQAVEIARETIPDIILLDMKMPVMDGYAAAASIRSDRRTKDIPIIALTASAMKGDDIKIKRAGCNGYIPKPVEQQALMTEMVKFLPDKIKSAPKPPKKGIDVERIEDDYVDIKDRKGLLAKLKGDLFEKKEKISHSLVIGAVKNFADEVVKTGEEFKSAALQKYGKNLNDLADNFDLVNLRKAIKNFDSAIEKIEELGDE